MHVQVCIHRKIQCSFLFLCAGVWSGKELCVFFFFLLCESYSVYILFLICALPPFPSFLFLSLCECRELHFSSLQLRLANRSQVPCIPDRTGSFRCPFQRLNERKRGRMGGGWGGGAAGVGGFSQTEHKMPKFSIRCGVFFFLLFCFPMKLAKPLRDYSHKMSLVEQVQSKRQRFPFSNSF